LPPDRPSAIHGILWQQHHKIIAPSSIVTKPLQLKEYFRISEHQTNSMAATVEIYTWSTCPFCIRAKQLLDRKGVEYTEYCLDGDEAGRNKMADRAGGRKSVPQIFINDNHIGGCDDIHALEQSGKLGLLLKAS
jgi:glutaredoxin 3